jgi:hypothetical protein
MTTKSGEDNALHAPGRRDQHQAAFRSASPCTLTTKLTTAQMCGRYALGIVSMLKAVTSQILTVNHSVPLSSGINFKAKVCKSTTRPMTMLRGKHTTSHPVHMGSSTVPMFQTPASETGKMRTPFQPVRNTKKVKSRLREEMWTP